MAQTEKKKKKTGRPEIEPPSETKDLDRLFNYCLLGATNAELAKYFGVGPTTIVKWLKDSTSVFAITVKRGRDEADAKVTKSLYQRALGYSHKAVKIFYNSKTGETVEHEYIEHYPPSEIAAFFWLKNRQKDKWREKQELETTLNGKVDVSIDWSPAKGCNPLRSMEEIEKEAEAEEERLNNANDADNGA
jgi:hypothetical protein